MNLCPSQSLVAACVAALLAGCSLMPAYERPEPPVPAAFPYGSPSDQRGAADLEWQQFFPDGTLRTLIAKALANNRDLRVAALNIEQVRAQYDIRRADRFPTVGATVGGTRAPGASGSSVTSYTAGIAFSSWEIDLFGRVASLSEAALAQFFASEEGRKAVQVSLVASVATTWLSLAADDELLELTRRTLATREDSLRLTRLRFENGVASEIDYRLAQSLAETARATLAQLQRQRANDLNLLGLLLGEPVPPEFQTGATTQAVRLPDLPAGTPSDVLVQRPDVRQAEQQLVAANANIGAARAAFFPRITLTAGIGTASSDLSGLFGGGSWGWTAAPSLLQPIFDAGRNRAGLAAALAGRDIALAQYERAIQSAFREVADALAARTTWSDQLQAQSGVVAAEEARTRLARLRYEAGAASYLDLLDAQRSLFTAEQLLVQTRLARLQNQIQLYRALGGGWR
ncbi:efflux transporter outer membrane subunit [Ramlibacter albus]|uniref:Efflux transporter outer membrane subunit n=1 Tax=Ramlibacter albus TaxID=2079448 RepID=A0A923M593_9BURK|nr:efflux transporter outer membrane subunit [Ramlibacter albus]MBC5762986.1 efflux transporter outer membrane subunit [Ramlibacter albus]